MKMMEEINYISLNTNNSDVKGVTNCSDLNLFDHSDGLVHRESITHIMLSV